MAKRETRAQVDRRFQVQDWVEKQVLLEMHMVGLGGTNIDESIDRVKALCEEALPVLNASMLVVRH